MVNGSPEANVAVYVFSPGTTNQIPIYEDEGVTPITQPILTDSQGRYAFFVDVDAYPEIRLYLEKDGVDFSEVNEDLDGVPVPGAGGGAGTFTELTDTPSSYVGRGGDVVVVKATEDGIETQPWPVTGTVLNVFLSDDAADIGSYYYMYPDETGDGSTELTSPSLSTGDDQLLWSFVTEAGEPGINQLALGVYTATLFLKKSGNKDVRVYWKLFKRDTGGTETEILQSAVSDYLTADNSQYLISGYLNEDQALDPTDRLVLKLYANVSGTGTDVTVTLMMEGDYDSRLAIHVLSSAFSLDRLSDVTLTSPSDKQMLAYDAASEKWTNQTPTSLGLPSVTTADMDIYVATTGSDETGDGSSGNPYATIQHAIDTLPDLIAHSVTIHVADGTYNEQVNISNKVGVTSSASLTLEGNTTTPANVVIDGGGTRDYCIYSSSVVCNFTIRGFQVQNAQRNNIRILGCPDLVLNNIISTGCNNTSFLEGSIHIISCTLNGVDNVHCNDNSNNGLFLQGTTTQLKNVTGFEAKNNGRSGIRLADSHLYWTGADTTNKDQIDISLNDDDGLRANKRSDARVDYATLGGNTNEATRAEYMSYSYLAFCTEGGYGDNGGSYDVYAAHWSGVRIYNSPDFTIGSDDTSTHES